MYSHQSFQTRGPWSSALFHSPPSTFHREAFRPPPLSPQLSYSSPASRGPLTPPEDVDGMYASLNPSSNLQELGKYHAARESASYGSFSTWGPHDGRSAGQQNYQSHAYQQSYPTHRQSQQHQSSITHSRPVTPDASQPSYGSLPSQQSRTASVASLIAPSLQIPQTINNSKGSLAAFAAQITCLFWFESANTLDLAENYSAIPPAPLNAETIPTTGFRKFVTTLLSTTQVAQNVVLLGLLFIYRLKKQNPSVKGKLGSEYRLLTVALMLGNKFLDDNTYTNKTWADVSGISVNEVHIMEVEFLSNMKYNLFTTAEQWDEWQSKLQRFDRFIEHASMAQHQPSNTMTLLQSGFGSNTLPSPPNSHHTSPPQTMASAAVTGSTLPPPTSLALPSRSASFGPSYTTPAAQLTSKRKRSMEDDEGLYATKRHIQSQGPIATPNYGQLPYQASEQRRSMTTAPTPYSFEGSMPMVSNAMASSKQLTQQRHQYETRSRSALAPPTQQTGTLGSSQPPAWLQNAGTPSGNLNAMASALRSAQTSRTHSPYLPSTHVSPTSTTFHPAGGPSTHHSPSFFLSARDSPYKPVRGVHTLLVPPPERALHQPGQVGNSQMHYQPLGRPSERQTGRLPYVAQDQWFDPAHQKNSFMGQWSGFPILGAQHAPQLPVPRI